MSRDILTVINRPTYQPTSAVGAEIVVEQLLLYSVSSSYMQVFPTTLSEPDSRSGVYVYVCLYGLLSLLIGATIYWQPGSLTLSITPQSLVGATTLGISLATALTYGSFISERFQWLWADTRIRFTGLFVLIFGVQVLLGDAPTWTALTLLSMCLASIPLRVGVYARTS